MPRTGDTHVRFLGMILSFSLMTPFMMPVMVLEPADKSSLPLPLRYLEYFIIAFSVLGVEVEDEAAGVSPDACWSKLPSRKLYTS